MHIVAVSAEPEFVKVEPVGDGGADLTIELARLEITGAVCAGRRTGSIQLHLMRADVSTIVNRLAAIKLEELTSGTLRYRWFIKFRNDRMGFIKTKHIEAATNFEASQLAYFELTSDGYEIADFSIIECTRGHQVGS